MVALPRSGPSVDTNATLLAENALAGPATEPAVLENCTDPPKAPVRFAPLQLPLKLVLKLLSMSGSVKVGAIAKALTLPCLSVACTR